ncbi:MAG: chemotaxis protein CheC [Candidatus Lokiarchaeota archaeon]|nr:chemotaxis protein CheC [Candidatus Lokiarchaeota archaeon]
MMEVENMNNITSVVIEVQREKYLLEVENVKEIYVPNNEIVPVPLAEESILGIIDIRGIVYTVLSLRHIIYGKETEHNLSENSRILLLEFKGLNLGLLVDDVHGVKKFSLGNFKQNSAIVKTNLDLNLVKLIGTLDGQSLVLLDLDSLIEWYLSNLEIKQLKKQEKIPKALSQPEILPKKTKKKTLKSQKVILHKKAKKRSPQKEYKLSEYQLETLQEIGNIGAGNAVTALSRLINKKIDVNLTDVGIITVDKLSEQFQRSSEKVCGIFCHVKKSSQSTILNIFEMKPLMKLVANLAGNKSKFNPEKVKSKEDLDSFAVSTIIEMGNIMAGHYVSALADLTGTKMMIDIPEFAMSDSGLLGEFLAKELKSISKYVVIIKTSINISDLKLTGVFFFIPDVEALEGMFKRLEVAFKAPTDEVIADEVIADEVIADEVTTDEVIIDEVTTKEVIIDEITTKEVTIEEVTTKEVTTDSSIDLESFSLTEIQRDALQEIGNIGAGNAANALAQMVKKQVDINIPAVEMVELDKFANTLSRTTKKLLVAWSNVSGKTRATVLTIFDVKDIIDLTSIIVDDKKKTQIDLRKKFKSVNDFPELYKGAMSELGHILGSNYISAIGDLLGMRLMTDPPDMSLDTGKQLFNILKDEIGLVKKLSLVITTNVIIKDFKVTGTFLYIPNIDTLQELLDALLAFYT